MKNLERTRLKPETLSRSVTAAIALVSRSPSPCQAGKRVGAAGLVDEHAARPAGDLAGKLSARMVAGISPDRHAVFARFAGAVAIRGYMHR